MAAVRDTVTRRLAATPITRPIIVIQIGSAIIMARVVIFDYYYYYRYYFGDTVCPRHGYATPPSRASVTSREKRKFPRKSDSGAPLPPGTFLPA